MLNSVFRLTKSVPRLCNITVPDLCKPSILSFIMFEFKISVPSKYYTEFTFVFDVQVTVHRDKFL